AAGRARAAEDDRRAAGDRYPLHALMGPQGRVFGRDGGLDQVWRDILEGHEVAPSAVLLVDLLEHDAIAVIDCGRLECVRSDAGCIRQLRIDFPVLVHRRADRGYRAENEAY